MDAFARGLKIAAATHNVFGIQVGVSVSLFVRQPKPKP